MGCAMRVFRVTVLETRVYAVERLVVAADDLQAKELAVANDWSTYDGIADAGESFDGSVVSSEVDDCLELTEADARELQEQWAEDWTIIHHVEREEGPKLFFAAVPPPANPDEDAQDKHLYGI
jgi:hypothetical protein